MIKNFILSACCIMAFVMATAQRFAGHPPSTKWKQINTDTVRVVFPAGFEKQALDVVATAHALGYRTEPTIGDRLRKISIVLQPRTTFTNGYVALGPWRSEFYLTPAQNSFELGALPWHRFLALHEYRHIQQYGNFNKGVSKVFSILFGQDGLSLAASAAVPNWFWEGDAVYQETLMSNQGRGRLPFFHNDYRSLWMANKNYSWMKLRNGSLRDFVPDHYRLGYMMVAYGREKYGEDLWRKVTDDAVRYKGLFYPFQRAVKKYAGKDYKTFRREALDYFEEKTGKGDEQDSVSIWAQQQKHFADNEEYPQWIDENSVVYVRSSYRRIPAFYVRDVVSGQDKKVRVKDISLDNYFSYLNGRVAYAAYEPDRLWNWIDFSVIKVLDLNTNQQRTLTHRSYYYAPDISEDGKQVVAVQVLPGGNAALHILDAGSGEVIRELPNSQQFFYTYPKFYANNTIVSAVRNTAGKMSLVLINAQNGAIEEELLPFSYNVIGFPVVRGDTITFTSSHNGKDELFAYIGKRIYQLNTDLVNSGTGNYQLSLFNDKAAFTAFTAAGFHMQVIQKPELVPFNSMAFAGIIPGFGVAALAAHDTLTLPAAITDTVSKYHKAFHLINFHSWRPYISDPDYSFSILSENVLNTLQAELYFNYNRNEKFKQAGASLIYGGIFPYISASFYGTFERSSSDTISTYNWNEYDGRLGVQAPFNFTSGSTYKNLSLSAGINHKQVKYTGVAKTRYEDVRFNYFDLSSSFSIQSQQARMHIYPRLGNSFFARYRAAINGLTARQMLVSNSLYLPGIDQTHNIVIQAAWQGRDTMLQYVFPNSFPFSRGYTNVNAPRMWKIGVNYHLPLLYPDRGFGNIVYFMRVRGNAFHDYSEIKSLRTGQKFGLSSSGAEIFFDTKWWNEYEVTFGIRYSRLHDGELLGLGPNQWEFILPVNLLGR
jgi:hypothetical protein